MDRQIPLSVPNIVQEAENSCTETIIDESVNSERQNTDKSTIFECQNIDENNTVGANKRNAEKVYVDLNVDKSGNSESQEIDKSANYECKNIDKSVNYECQNIDKTANSESQNIYENDTVGANNRNGEKTYVDLNVDKSGNSESQEIDKSANYECKNIDKSANYECQNIDKSANSESQNIDENGTVGANKRNGEKGNFDWNEKDDENTSIGVNEKDSEKVTVSKSKNLVFLDHQYLANHSDVSSINSGDEEDDDPEENAKYAMATGLNGLDSSSNFQGHLKSILTGSMEFTKKKIQNMLNKFITPKPDSEDAHDILKADDIQKHFQDVITMTSFQPISDLDAGSESDKKDKIKNESDKKDEIKNKCNSDTKLEDNSASRKMKNMVKMLEKMTVEKKIAKVTSCQNIPKSSKSSEKYLNESNVRKSTSLPISCNRTVNYNEWLKIRRDTQEEVRFNSLLSHAMSLMVKKWSEYLALSLEEIQEFELEHARQENMCDEVIEMLGDRDRYVWQLIEEL